MSEKCGQEVALSQLSHINSRISVYVTRLWQMPFAYLAIVCVSLTQFNSMKEDINIYIISAVLLAAGLTIMAMIRNHFNRVDLLITLAHSLESSVGLEESLEKQKLIPYYCLMSICCIAICVSTYFHYIGNSS